MFKKVNFEITFLACKKKVFEKAGGNAKILVKVINQCCVYEYLKCSGDGGFVWDSEVCMW